MSWLFLGNACPVANRDYSESCKTTSGSASSYSCLERSYKSVYPYDQDQLESRCGAFSLEANADTRCTEENSVLVCVKSDRMDELRFFYYLPTTETAARLECENGGGRVL